MSNTDPPKTAVNSGALSQEQSEDTKEEQTMQSTTERDKKCATKHYIDIKDWEKTNKKQRNTRVNSGRIIRSCSTSDRRRITVKPHEHQLTWKSCWTSVCVNKYKDNKLTITPPQYNIQYIWEYRTLFLRRHFLQFIYIIHSLSLYLYYVIR